MGPGMRTNTNPQLVITRPLTMMLISKRLFVLLWIIHYLFLFRNKLQKNSLEDTYSLKNKNQKQNVAICSA